MYKPQTSRDVMRRAAIRELVEGYFDGSEESLLEFLRGPEERAVAAAAGAEDTRIDTILL